MDFGPYENTTHCGRKHEHVWHSFWTKDAVELTCPGFDPPYKSKAERDEEFDWDDQGDPEED